MPFFLLLKENIQIHIQAENMEEILYVCVCVLKGQVWGSFGKGCTDGDRKEQNFCMSDKWNPNNSSNLVVPNNVHWNVFVLSTCCLIWKWSLFLQLLNMCAFLCIERTNYYLFCNYFQKAENVYVISRMAWDCPRNSSEHCK